ncbi:hypothetical protein [Nonomuraea sp. NPDC049158]|uniref:hypothetical protein n=1 Tax=Nonomuraea sp. NPDC049158 TaxID=3155649 RepID=UPI0034108A4D
MITREIQLTTQIVGAPTLDHFAVAKTEVDGEVLVRTDQIGLAATYLELMRADCTIPVRPGSRGSGWAWPPSAPWSAPTVPSSRLATWSSR